MSRSNRHTAQSFIKYRWLSKAALSLSLAILVSIIGLQATYALELDEQRYHYEMAKAQLKADKSTAFQKHYQLLGNYPLRVYLDYGQATKALENGEYALAEAFINTQKGSYLGDRLYRRFLYTLAKEQNEQDLIYWYNSDAASTSVQCRWLEARINKGETAAFSEVADIWRKPKSHPKECDRVFGLWIKSDAFDTHVVWERFIASLKSKQRGLARYVASLLPEIYQPHVKTAWALDSRPERIAKTNKYADGTAVERDLITFGVWRLARRQPNKAISVWRNYEARYLYNEAEIRQVKLRILKQLIRKDKLEEAKKILVNSPSLRSESITEHLVRELLRENRWEDVLFGISLLPADSQEKDRWRYWRAKSESQLSGSLNAEHREVYRQLSEQRSFYGFLASDILGKSYSFAHEYSPQDAATSLSLQSIPAAVRAKELWLQGHLSEAQAEWSYTLNRLSARELGVAGSLAHSWGWHEGAIRAMVAGRHWNHLDERFPLAFSNQIERAASAHRVQAELIYAIARQESAMSPSARSSAGARGVMQLMPTTARQTASKHGLKHTTTDLYRPDHNIDLGTAYLSELLEKYQGNRILAAAAYNAGPYRVNNWRNDSNSQLSFDVWIETIPFKETRRYVKNVLTYSLIYSYRMGDIGTLVSDSEAKLKL